MLAPVATVRPHAVAAAATHRLRTVAPPRSWPSGCARWPDAAALPIPLCRRRRVSHRRLQRLGPRGAADVVVARGDAKRAVSAAGGFGSMSGAQAKIVRGLLEGGLVSIYDGRAPLSGERGGGRRGGGGGGEAEEAERRRRWGGGGERDGQRRRERRRRVRRRWPRRAAGPSPCLLPAAQRTRVDDDDGRDAMRLAAVVAGDHVTCARTLVSVWLRGRRACGDAAQLPRAPPRELSRLLRCGAARWRPVRRGRKRVWCTLHRAAFGEGRVGSGSPPAPAPAQAARAEKGAAAGRARQRGALLALRLLSGRGGARVQLGPASRPERRDLPGGPLCLPRGPRSRARHDGWRRS